MNATPYDETPKPYRAYLLRLWQGERRVWHASLEEPSSGRRVTFSDLDRLFVFLVEQTETAVSPPVVSRV